MAANYNTTDRKNGGGGLSIHARSATPSGYKIARICARVGTILTAEKFPADFP